MNNRKRIAIAAVKADLYTAEEAKKILESNQQFDLHTLSRWNQIGHFKLKDGEVGIPTKLWRKKENGGFFLVQVILYARNQLIEVE